MGRSRSRSRWRQQLKNEEADDGDIAMRKKNCRGLNPWPADGCNSKFSWHKVGLWQSGRAAYGHYGIAALWQSGLMLKRFKKITFTDNRLNHYSGFLFKARWNSKLPVEHFSEKITLVALKDWNWAKSILRSLKNGLGNLISKLSVNDSLKRGAITLESSTLALWWILSKKVLIFTKSSF